MSKPPYSITTQILNFVSAISEKIGEIKAARLVVPPAELRRRNRIKTIQSSLEIEGNTLTVEQVTDIINHKRVLAPEKDLLEVHNAIKVYSMMGQFNPRSMDSLCKAHGILMKGLLESPGRLMSTSVGIARGEAVAHVAPPGTMVSPLLKNLFRYLKDDNDLLIIKSCVFHYEFEFIHPFTDGNGRMGRLWQSLILMEYSPVFAYLPVESLIKERQTEYYSALAMSDSQGNSTVFIEFMLEIIIAALEELLRTQNHTATAADRIIQFRTIAEDKYFTRLTYLRHNKEISPATASRDLREAVEKGILKKEGDKRMTRYRFLQLSESEFTELRN